MNVIEDKDVVCSSINRHIAKRILKNFKTHSSAASGFFRRSLNHVNIQCIQDRWCVVCKGLFNIARCRTQRDGFDGMRTAATLDALLCHVWTVRGVAVHSGRRYHIPSQQFYLCLQSIDLSFILVKMDLDTGQVSLRALETSFQF